MKSILTACLATISLAAAPSFAQLIRCYGNYCSGYTSNGQSVNVNTYGNYTSGTVGGRSLQMQTYGNYTSGTIAGQRFSCNTYGGRATCY